MGLVGWAHLLRLVYGSLAEILRDALGGRAAVALPEAGICITYEGLRERAIAMADSQAAAGIGLGNRVAIVPFREDA